MVLNDVPDDILQKVRGWRDEKVEIENSQMKR